MITDRTFTRLRKMPREKKSRLRARYYCMCLSRLIRHGVGESDPELGAAHRQEQRDIKVWNNQFEEGD